MPLDHALRHRKALEPGSRAGRSGLWLGRTGRPAARLSRDLREWPNGPASLGSRAYCMAFAGTQESALPEGKTLSWLQRPAKK